MAKSAELDPQSYWEDSASVSRYPPLDRNLTVDAGECRYDVRLTWINGRRGASLLL